MPLPDWLKQQDDEPQPRAAAPVPDEEPEVQEPEAEEPGAEELEAQEPRTRGLQPLQAQAHGVEAEAPAIREPQGDAPEDDVPPTGNDQVLNMLSAIEQQLRQLGDVQRHHEDQLASLIERSESADDVEAGPADAEPQAKQPSFVVEMDDGEQAPRGSEGLQGMASELEGARQQTDRMREQLEEAQARIRELSDRADDGEDADEKAQELEEAHRKIEALQSRVIELEAVAAVSGDDEDDDDDDEKDERIAALNAQVAQLTEALEGRGEPEAKPAAASPDGASAEMIERQRKQIERLTEQLTALNAGADPAEIEERDARIAELEEELDELRGQGAGAQGVSKLVAGFGGALRHVRGKKGSDDGDEAAELQERVAELEVECQQLRDQLEGAGAGEGSGDDAEEIAALRARVAELQRNPAAAGGELRSKVETEFRQKWNELKRKQDALTATEEKMRRRWARPQAVVVFGWLAGLAVVVGIVSWLMAGRLFPPTIAASLSVEAKSRTGVPVSQEDKVAWQQVHTAMLSDGAFQKDVAKRLADRRFDDFKDPDVLTERLQRDLTVDSPEAGAITLTLAGTNRDQTMAVLDTVATSLALWSSQQAGLRGDGAVAWVRGERRESGQVRYATINETPIRDRRALWSLILFGAGFVVSYFLISRIGQGLLKAKSAMEEDEFGAAADVF